MKKRIRNIFTIFASVVTGGVCSWLFLHDDAGLRRKFADARAVSSVQNGDASNSGVNANGESSEQAIDVSEQKDKKNVDSARKSSSDDKDADEELTSFQRALLDELQQALDNDSLKSVRKVIAKFSSGDGRGFNVPYELKEKAIEALSWFGKDGAMDLVAFVCDPNNEISDEAFDRLEDALNDPDMSDYDRAEYVKALLRATSNADRIDSMLSDLGDMRNSVKGRTIIEILQSGTSKSVEMLMDEIESLTEEGVKSVEDVRKWMEENPDDPEDDELYGKK